MMLLFLEEVNKKMNSTVQHSLFVSSKWCDWPWARAVEKFGHLCHEGPRTDGAFDYNLDPIVRPFRGSHSTNKGIDWMLGQFSHKGTEPGSFEKPNGLATQPVPL